MRSAASRESAARRYRIEKYLTELAWREGWVAVIRPANILFEVDGVTEAIARESMRLAATKLPIRTKFVSRHSHAH